MSMRVACNLLQLAHCRPKHRDRVLRQMQLARAGKTQMRKEPKLC